MFNTLEALFNINQNEEIVIISKWSRCLTKFLVSLFKPIQAIEVYEEWLILKGLTG